MTEPVQVSVQPTPNPNSAKFVLDRPVSGGEMRSYMRKEEAAGDPLGEAIFAIEGVETVFMMADFITVNKASEADWADLAPRVEEAIRAHL
ncbi:MAG: NifU N-terminal domain-containing protein [Nitrospinota bacterium]